MIKAHPSVIRLTLIYSIFQFIQWQATAQSVLLIRSNTTVYDSYKDDKVELLKLKEETWVNYKGKYAEFFKVSNFFGKDEYYPNGIFEGYIQINSVLDTSNRKEYKNLVLVTMPTEKITMPSETVTASSEPESLNNITTEFDIENLYLGMPETDARLSSNRIIKISDYEYKIRLHYNAEKRLDKIEMSGNQEDAMAIDASIKNQIIQLKEILSEKNGAPTALKDYPNFLELDEEKVNNIYKWELPTKLILIGIGEDKALYYASVIFILK